MSGIIRQYIVTVAADTREIADKLVADKLGPTGAVNNVDPTTSFHYYGAGFIHAVLDTETLRQDWTDDPNLTDEQRAALAALPDDEVDDVLAENLERNEDTWFSFLDGVRADATYTLTERMAAH